MLESICTAALLAKMLQAVEPHQFELMSDRDGCCFQILVYHVRNAAHLKHTFVKATNTFNCLLYNCCSRAANAIKICFMIRCH